MAGLPTVLITLETHDKKILNSFINISKHILIMFYSLVCTIKQTLLKVKTLKKKKKERKIYLNANTLQGSLRNSYHTASKKLNNG